MFAILSACVCVLTQSWSTVLLLYCFGKSSVRKWFYLINSLLKEIKDRHLQLFLAFEVLLLQNCARPPRLGAARSSPRQSSTHASCGHVIHDHSSFPSSFQHSRHSLRVRYPSTIALPTLSLTTGTKEPLVLPPPSADALSFLSRPVASLPVPFPT